MKTSDSIHNIVSQFYSLKLFTHAYIEYGYASIDQSEHIYEFYEDPRRYIFDVASITKAIVTTPLCLKTSLIKKLELDNTIQDYLSNIVVALDSCILSLTLRELLTHTSGLPAWRNFYVCRSDKNIFVERWDEQWFIKKINSFIPYVKKHRGERIYSDIGFMLLGYVLEKIYSSSLSHLFITFCNEDLDFKVDAKEFGYADTIDKTKCISTGYCALRNRNLIGEANDENCVSLGGIMGHAGFFSSGKLFSQFFKKFIFSYLGNQLFEYLNNNILIGWQRGDDKITQHLFNGKVFGHYGFTGTAFWININDKRLPYCIIFTNRTINNRNNPLIKDFRVQIFQCIDDFFQKM